MHHTHRSVNPVAGLLLQGTLQELTPGAQVAKPEHHAGRAIMTKRPTEGAEFLIAVRMAFTAVEDRNARHE